MTEYNIINIELIILVIISMTNKEQQKIKAKIATINVQLTILVVSLIILKFIGCV